MRTKNVLILNVLYIYFFLLEKENHLVSQISLENLFSQKIKLERLSCQN